MTEPISAAAAIEKALAETAAPLSVDEICKLVYKRIGARERNTVHQNLYRLEQKGRLEVIAKTYRLKTA